MNTLKIYLLISLAALLAACNNSQTSTSDTFAQETTHLQLDTLKSEPADSEPVLPAPLTLAFVGDIMPGTTFPEEEPGAFLPQDDGAHLFDHVKEILRGADFAAGNLEGTLLDEEGELKECKDPELCYAFRIPTRYAGLLTDAGIDFVGIANNHINDFGAPGIESTRRTLRENELLYAGLRDGCRTAIAEKDRRKVGFAAFGHSKGTPSIMNLEEVRTTVRKLAKECDFVVVSFHGGAEGAQYTHVPHAMEICFNEKRGNVEAFAHAAIDAGADVVYGHGPHVTRAMELYKGRLVIYSLGNFCTPFRVNLQGVNGHAPVVTVTLNPDGSFGGGRIYPFIQQFGKGPQPDATGAVIKQIQTLTSADFPSTPLKIASDGTLSR